MNYTLRDLGASFSPWNLNNHGDVGGRERSAGEPPAVRLADGTAVALPPEMFLAWDISDQGVVLGRAGAWEPILFELATATAQPISLPGFSYIPDMAMN